MNTILYNFNEDELYDLIKKNYNFNHNEFNIHKISLDKFDNFKILLNNDTYFDWNFCTKYANNCKYAYFINYKDINFYILTNIQISQKIKIHLYKCVYRTFLIKNVYNIKPEQYINFYIILNPLKRKLPNKKTEIINAKNINGGFTYINTNNIYIVRKEDYEKVIIHELLHHNNFIHYEDWNIRNIKTLKNICRIEKTQIFIPNEAIVETFAIILNVIFASIENNISFKKILNKDRKHNLIIAKKIIDKQGNNVWKEKTHSYCYIVIRAVFYLFFKEFVKIYKGTNDDDITNFIIEYLPKIMSKIKKLPNNKNNNIKQTIFHNF
jgi:hypothetical protein